MVDTFAAFLDKLGNGALVRGRFEEFDFGITHLEEGGFYFLVGYFFYGVAFQSQYVLIVRERVGDAFYGNAQMFDMRKFHRLKN